MSLIIQKSVATCTIEEKSFLNIIIIFTDVILSLSSQYLAYILIIFSIGFK